MQGMQCPMRDTGLPMENLLIERMDIILKCFVSHSSGRQMHNRLANPLLDVGWI